MTEHYHQRNCSGTSADEQFGPNCDCLKPVDSLKPMVVYWSPKGTVLPESCYLALSSITGCRDVKIELPLSFLCNVLDSLPSCPAKQVLFNSIATQCQEKLQCDETQSDQRE